MDDDKVYELLEQVRSDLQDVLSTVWEATGDKELWKKIHGIAGYGGDATHRGIEKLLDEVLEAAGIETCEHCGERVEQCTCDDDDAEETEQSVETVA